ncbi:DinB family protein [Mucilaginibacter terrenus]|uniref:DinB family protein n=1 Tax=Mucilaginibacter terrenus TaxID=2482727 RepID=A0A3E2NWF4_9SPHI|nr:DinB family protein [Mucilaginibacter terrenus]RFZ85343.1 DinB family protein [Mucilaginibacter terrenus]
MNNQPEVWLRGPLDNMPALTQPVAHALLQAREEVNAFMTDWPDEKLWDKVYSMASVGFHLQHMTGVLDRLFTYARGEKLSTEQLAYLQAEGKPTTIVYTTSALVGNFNRQVDKALQELSQIDPKILTDFRAVGRTELPSTVIGLYVHAAEHTMRHLGQLLVTANVVNPPLQS